MHILASIYFGILGLAIGSFLNVLIDRLPEEQGIAGRSKCDHCGKTLSFFELIPLVSFIFQKGSSRCCKKKLSVQYPLVEVFTAVIFVLIALVPMQRSTLSIEWATRLLYMSMASICIVIFVADLKTQIIPDEMQIAGVVVGTGLIVILACPESTSLMHSIDSGCSRLTYVGITRMTITSVISAAIVASPILLLFLLTRGRGMGFGDVKWAAVMGYILGWWAGLVALYISFILGGIVGAGLVLFSKKGMKSQIAFGPFLVVGFVLMVIYSRR